MFVCVALINYNKRIRGWILRDESRGCESGADEEKWISDTCPSARQDRYPTVVRLFFCLDVRGMRRRRIWIHLRGRCDEARTFPLSPSLPLLLISGYPRCCWGLVKQTCGFYLLSYASIFQEQLAGLWDVGWKIIKEYNSGLFRIWGLQSRL